MGAMSDDFAQIFGEMCAEISKRLEDEGLLFPTMAEDATRILQEDLAVHFLSQDYEPKPCYYCGELTNSFAGDPSVWPLHFPHPDEPGVVKQNHVGCVMKRLQAAERKSRLLQALGYAVAPAYPKLAAKIQEIVADGD